MLFVHNINIYYFYQSSFQNFLWYKQIQSKIFRPAYIANDIELSSKNVPMLCLKFQNLQMSPQKHETSVMVGPSIDHGYLMLHTFLTRKKYIPTLYYYIIRCWLFFFHCEKNMYACALLYDNLNQSDKAFY